MLLCSGSLSDTGRIELSCEAESLHMKLSAVLGHFDQPQFPHPPSPPPPPTIFSFKRKSPSQLSRQERRCHEAVYFVEEHCMVDKTAPHKVNTPIPEKPRPSEKNIWDGENHYVETTPALLSFQ